MTSFICIIYIYSLVLSVLVLGGHLLASGELQPGQLMAFLVASQGVQRSISQGSILLGVLIRGMTAANRVFEVFHTCLIFHLFTDLFFVVFGN